MIDFKGVDKDAKIVVALSGGVDSSTTIALLKEQGYHNIIALTLILHDIDEKLGIYSKDQNIREDCLEVANHLGVEHHFIDIKEEFKKEIIVPFLENSIDGITANPCIKCNRKIKFGVLLKEAQRLGADIFVTGHYIKWDFGEDNQGAIYKSKIENKDQSYFLSQVKKDVLKFIRFPLANMTKNQVREEAKRLGVHVAKKKSSSDLCFTGKNSHTQLIDRLYNPKAGNIIDIKGNILARHNGIHLFTIGQRKGIGVGGFAEARYVVEIKQETNEVVLGKKEDLARDNIKLTEINWLGEEDFSFEKKQVFAKVRAAQALVKADIYPVNETSCDIIFHQDIFGVARGQICAFYDENDKLLGGGYI